MIAIDAGEVTPANTRPVDGETWWRGVEHLHKLGFNIPRYEIPEEDRKYNYDLPPLLGAALEIEDDTEISVEDVSAPFETTRRPQTGGASKGSTETPGKLTHNRRRSRPTAKYHPRGDASRRRSDRRHSDRTRKVLRDRVDAVEFVEIKRNEPGARVAEVTVGVSLVESVTIQFAAEVG